MKEIIAGIIYLIAAPFVGGILTGIDRILSARAQRRKGPPLLQPFYDVLKLYGKKNVIVNHLVNPYIFCHLAFMMATGYLFFEGSDILLIIFVFTLSTVFLVVAAFSTNSPFSTIGANRELILMMAYEPMVIFTLVGFYKVTGSFRLYEIIASGKPLILYLPGIFAGFVYILTIKLRKSPFDISWSHHAHQELVKGIASDFSGRSIAMMEIAKWYEDVFLYGLIYLFFAFNPWIAAGAIAFVFILEIIIDNSFARFKWELTLKSAWLVAFVLGFGNIVALYAWKR